ncbi:GNAT family N-acetyltransferase [Aquabacter sp. CN5-332]|uniref:GNAT family N-acetyltransferase n=1 Tax=Aquabacter sp. CN5-332 TaxID=3156608 RepID=UPI0032B57F6A
MTLLPRLLAHKAEPHLRAATAADAAALALIHAGSFHRGWGADEFERLLADRAAHAHVLTYGAKGAPFAFVLSHVVPPEAEILSIAVAPDARGKGHGAKLLSYHLGRLACEGVRVSHLEVEATNEAALHLYRRLGYVETGRRKGYYAGPGGAADAVVMRRDF